MTAPHKFTHPPPVVPDNMAVLSFPAPHILHVALNRPKAFNAMSHAFSAALTEVFDWFESEGELRVAILGSTNRKAWCAGADLKEWKDNTGKRGKGSMPRAGFAGMSMRFTRKPVIGAINGVALGGGLELALNLDMNVAGQTAVFGYPEVKRGVSIQAGGLQRFVRLVGHQKAVEAILIGENISAQQAQGMGFVNEVVADDDVEKRALQLALAIAGNSPDSVMALLYAIRLTAEVGSLQEATNLYNDSLQNRQLLAGDNIKEGLLAFQERRQPRWVPSKL